jgi:hypothetical protein
MLVLNERSEHQDLHGSDRRSIISYVYGRMRVVLFKHCLFLLVALSGLKESKRICLIELVLRELV